jgi:hypothetical protein
MIESHWRGELRRAPRDVRHLIEFFPMTEDKHQFGRQDVNEIGTPFHNSLRKIVATTLTEGLTHPEAGYIPLAILVCEKCGLMTYHHLSRLKIAY